MLPLKVYKRLNNGGKDEAQDHPAYYLIHDEPNPELTSFTWREVSQGPFRFLGKHVQLYRT